MAGNKYIADLQTIPTIEVGDVIPIQKGSGGPNSTYKVPYNNILSHLESVFATNVRTIEEKSSSFDVSEFDCGTMFVINSGTGTGSPSVGTSQVFVSLDENLPVGFNFSVCVLENEYVYFDPPFGERIRNIDTNITAGIPFNKFDEAVFTKITSTIWNYVLLNEYNPVSLQVDYIYYQTINERNFLTTNDLYFICQDAD